MDKSLLLQQILDELEAVYQGAVDAAMLAYNTATHGENVAENKYDTLGLEAAYLAHGQAQRVDECKADWAQYQRLTATKFSHNEAITIGALVSIKDASGAERSLFLGPAAGGLKFSFCQKDVMLITPSAPLGKALLGHFVDDEIEMNIEGQQIGYVVTAIY